MILALLVAFTALGAEDPDTRYLRIFGIIEKADSLHASGETNAAMASYREAQSELLSLKKDRPTWNVKLVSYRLNYIAGKFAALSQPAVRPGEPAAVAATRQESRPGASMADAHGVRVIDAGAEPRQVLRYRVTPDAPESMRMTVRLGMGGGAAGAQAGVQTIKVPPIQLRAKVTPKAVSAEGDIDYGILFEEASIGEEEGAMPQMVEAMKAAFAGVKGMQINSTMSDRGVIKKTEVQIPPGADQEARQSMEQMKKSFSDTEFLLPEVAVGMGAKWEVRRKGVDLDGVKVDETATHTLVLLEGDTFTVTSSKVQHAASQKISNPMMPQMTVDLTRLTGTGKTTMSGTFSKIMPSSATVENHTELTMVMDMGGRKQPITTKIDTNVRIETR